jgi:hypothetical protein
MPVFKQFIDLVTGGSDRPVRRLIAYYAILIISAVALHYFFPATDRLLLGRDIEPTADTPRLLQDGLAAVTNNSEIRSLAELAITTLLILVGSLVLMLPVSWVYMSARQVPGHNQSVVQTLIILPLVVAGIVLIVRNSLALAFSLAGVVAAVRFRITMRDARDIVFIFLAIAVGFSGGVQTLAVGALLSMMFNFVVLITWRYDFGRNLLMPTAASQWAEPLNRLASRNGNGGVPDRDLMLALTPEKVEALAQRFGRVRAALGPSTKKPRYNAVLSIATDHLGEVQVQVQKVLNDMTKRWTLDEVVTNKTGKPSELYYLIRMRRSLTREELLTAIRAQAGDRIVTADLELGDGLVREEKAEKKEEKKEEKKDEKEQKESV